MSAPIDPRPPGQPVLNQAQLHSYCKTLVDLETNLDKNMLPSIQEAFTAMAQTGNDKKVLVLGKYAMTVETARRELPLLAKIAGRFSDAHLVTDKQAQPMLTVIRQEIDKNLATKSTNWDSIEKLYDAREKLVLHTLEDRKTQDSPVAAQLQQTLIKPIREEIDKARTLEVRVQKNKDSADVCKSIAAGALSATPLIAGLGFLVPPLLILAAVAALVGLTTLLIGSFYYGSRIDKAQAELDQSVQKVEILKNAKAFFDSDAFKEQMLNNPPTAEQIKEWNTPEKLLQYVEQMKAELAE